MPMAAATRTTKPTAIRRRMPKNISRAHASASGQTAPPPDRTVREAEGEIDSHADEEDDDHQREQLLSVSEVVRELELLADRWLVRDDVDDLGRHEAAPRERPPLLQAPDVAGQRSRQDDVPVELDASRPHDPTDTHEQRLHMIDAGEQAGRDRRGRTED